MKRILDVKSVMLAGCLLVLVLLGINFWQRSVSPEVVPDFAAYAVVEEKKQAFFDFVRPSIRIENSLILAERQALLDIKATAFEADYTDFEVRQIRMLAEKYRVPNRDVLSDNEVLIDLMSRVDVVPEGLALAQAANESAWGTSRFARDYRNFFGLWCFTKGCGVKPRQASAESTHQVAAFDSVRAGVAYYLLTLNSHPAYASLRSRRQDLQLAGQAVTGDVMAEGLMRYSERGQDYVDEIKQMIRDNGLE
ncbi:MAG: glucosaminidase domain-containing protein [Pseudomonadales bacterium]|nr:glucosaminidase domain-containing protein [Pseudomonadales bacterium]